MSDVELRYANTGAVFGRCKNLRSMPAWAKRFGGCSLIEVTEKDDGGALVFAWFGHGRFQYARADFADYAVARVWAHRRSSRRGTWFSGCEVRLTPRYPNLRT